MSKMGKPKMPTEISDRRREYILQHYQYMSDKEMARALSLLEGKTLKEQTVAGFRIKMLLGRHGPLKAQIHQKIPKEIENPPTLTYLGKTQTISEWAEELQIPRLLIDSRIRSGWSTEDALNKPVRKSKIKVLFRKDNNSREEMEIAQKYFNVVENRCAANRNDLVIGRYSVLPFYEELEKDLSYKKIRLINSYEQHQWIAKMEYYETVKEWTIPIWREEELQQIDHPGPFVVKGETNSRKHQWDTHMYAQDKKSLHEVMSRLRNDMLIGTQRLIIRPYIPLQTFETGLNGIRFTNEWRFFYVGENCIGRGYYWSEAENADKYNQEVPAGLDKFAYMIAQKVAPRVNFFVLDIAKKEDGKPILVEINDGQMSGLSMIDPDQFYKNLRKYVNKRERKIYKSSSSEK